MARDLYQIRSGKYIIVKVRQEAGGRRQGENNHGIKTGFSISSFFFSET
jgi:hypothetical protein